MLDPLTALGIAANVVQFIDFTIRIIAKSNDIYQSASGSLIEHDDMNKVTLDLSALSTKLRDSVAVTAPNAGLTLDEQALHDLSKGCLETSQELTKALQRLQNNGKTSRFRSFRQALKTVWSKDDIKELERRVGMYKEELTFRIVVGLRTQIDITAVQNTAGFASLAEDTKATIKSLGSIDADLKDGLNMQTQVLNDMRSHTEAAIEIHTKENKDDHERLSANISDLSQQSFDQSERVLDAQAITKMAVELSIDRNVAEHNKTRQEMNRLKEEAERQVEVLTEEIRQLKLELESSVKTIVASIGTASKKESQKLRDISNAKFNLWVAKELILEKLKAFIALFRFNFASEMWTAPTDLKSWKLMPYPKPFAKSPCEPTCASSGSAGPGEESMAYLHVDICYPLAARNVPMVKMCLDQGVGVNVRLPGEVGRERTPLTKAVETAFEYTAFDTISTIITMRRDSRKMVQLLLEYGADPNQKDGSGLSARNMADDPTQPDWLIQQLLRPDQHPYLRRFLAITDVVWAGGVLTLESMLVGAPQLCQLAEELGISPIGAAVFRADEKVVEVLLKNGTSPNAPDPIGASPLAIAVASGSEDMARLLLRHGASLTNSDPILCLTPLEYAAREGNHAMCGALLEHWTSQGRRDAHQLLSKPLALAVRGYHVAVVKILLESGADIFMNMCSFLSVAELELLRVSAKLPVKWPATVDNLLDQLPPRTPRDFVDAKIKAAGWSNVFGGFGSEEMQTLLAEYEEIAAVAKLVEAESAFIVECPTHDDQHPCNGFNKTSEVVEEVSICPSITEELSAAELDYLRKKARVLALQAKVASPSGSEQAFENGISVS